MHFVETKYDTMWCVVINPAAVYCNNNINVIIVRLNEIDNLPEEVFAMNY